MGSPGPSPSQPRGLQKARSGYVSSLNTMHDREMSVKDAEDRHSHVTASAAFVPAACIANGRSAAATGRLKFHLGVRKCVKCSHAGALTLQLHVRPGVCGHATDRHGV